MRTKRHAFAVGDWLQKIDDNLQPIVITGHIREIRMTQTDQKSSYRKFQKWCKQCLSSNIGC